MNPLDVSLLTDTHSLLTLSVFPVSVPCFHLGFHAAFTQVLPRLSLVRTSSTTVLSFDDLDRVEEFVGRLNTLVCVAFFS